MKQTIQRRLVTQGLAASDKEAAAWLLAGLVYVDGQRARSGMVVNADADIRVKGREERYLSKGGYKLEGALKAFSLSVQGKAAIDAGASTGGFTDCLLKHGAAHVYAVDVGFGQLMGSLRQDPRVTNLERTNIADPALLALSPRPTLGTCDLSYLSIRKAIPLFAAVLHGRGDLLCLVKPLFETDDMDARRTGELPPDSYAPLLQVLVRDINAMPGTAVRAVTHSPVTGNAATLEFFLHVALGENMQTADLTRDIEQSVHAALQLPTWQAGGDPMKELP